MFESRIRKWDPVAGLSLFAIMVIAAISVQLSYWTFNLAIVTQITIYALTVGFFVGYSKFKSKPALFLLTLYGIVFFLLGFAFSLSDHISWIDRLKDLAGRYASVFLQIRTRVPLDDGILFLTAMVILFLVNSLAAGFAYSRNQRPYLSLIVVSITFYSVQYFLSEGFRKPYIIFLFTFFLVLLIGRLNYLHHKERWVSEKFHQDRRAAWVFSIISIIIGLLSASMVVAVPVLYMQADENSGDAGSPRVLSSRSREWVSNLLNPLKPTKSFGEGMFTGVLPIGERRSTGDEIIFEVRKPELETSYGRYYWYAHIYSEYRNGAWENKGIQKASPLEIANADFSVAPKNDQEFAINYLAENTDLIFPQVFVQVERDIDIAHFVVDADLHDVLYLINYERINPGDEITLEGGYYDFYLDPEIEIVDEYPDWVVEKYLQLPEGMPSTIRFLAESITRREEGKTAKILAVTNYLRNNYTYSDAVEVPVGSDPIAWFLFDGKEGFCNYYASAQVLMLRSLGIPSRMAAGYAEGDYSEEKDAFQVRAKDSHAWVEVFYPNIGWVIFEPTPSQPAINYRETRTVAANGLDEPFAAEQSENTETEADDRSRDPEVDLSIDAPAESTRRMINRKNIFLVIGLVFSLAMVFFTLRGFVMRRRAIMLPISVQAFFKRKRIKIPGWIQAWAEYERLAPIVKNYRVIKMISIRLKLMPAENFTPREVISKINKVIDMDLASGRKFISWLDEALYGKTLTKYTEEMRDIFNLYLASIRRKWFSRLIKAATFRKRGQPVN